MGRRNTPIKKCEICGKEIYVISGGVLSAIHEPSSRKYCSRECYTKYRRENAHSKDKDRLFRVWRGMKERCSYKKHTSAKFYQNRGITVCAEWKSDFEAFKRWALANGYDYSKSRKEQSLDRIDNSKGYSPENCRWVSMVVNNQNTRRNVNLTFNGKTQCLSAWSRELNIPIETIRKRIKNGLPIEQVLDNRY